jgi:hypothetical protein
MPVLCMLILLNMKKENKRIVFKNGFFKLQLELYPVKNCWKYAPNQLILVAAVNYF